MSMRQKSKRSLASCLRLKVLPDIVSSCQLEAVVLSEDLIGLGNGRKICFQNHSCGPSSGRPHVMLLAPPRISDPKRERQSTEDQKCNILLLNL